MAIMQGRQVPSTTLARKAPPLFRKRRSAPTSHSLNPATGPTVEEEPATRRQHSLTDVIVARATIIFSIRRLTIQKHEVYPAEAATSSLTYLNQKRGLLLVDCHTDGCGSGCLGRGLRKVKRAKTLRVDDQSRKTQILSTVLLQSVTTGIKE
ncbi:hypothetical protein RJ640_011449 [Escallonia rubra]|uniref:Uncharacterized protein n=1 Tax=Escallonia rubra TaxID=112253 RepID=A0AA88UFY3_9ASTE|nr:hypothetical protein RJ640_011449 [Escallonia rubra]